MWVCKPSQAPNKRHSAMPVIKSGFRPGIPIFLAPLQKIDALPDHALKET